MQDFWLLLFAHLVGDYAFQTNEIAQNKTKNLVGLSKHIYLIFVANVMIVMPRTIESWIGITIITLIHFLEDSQPFSKKKGNVGIFLLDQAIHVSTILIVSRFISFYNPLLSSKTAYILSSFLFVVYFLDFVEFFILKKKSYSRDIIKVSYGALILSFTFYYEIGVPIVVFGAFLVNKNGFRKNWIYITLVTIISFFLVYLYKYIF
jgi:hypothetical protein